MRGRPRQHAVVGYGYYAACLCCRVRFSLYCSVSLDPPSGFCLGVASGFLSDFAPGFLTDTASGIPAPQLLERAPSAFALGLQARIAGRSVVQWRRSWTIAFIAQKVLPGGLSRPLKRCVAERARKKQKAAKKRRTKMSRRADSDQVVHIGVIQTQRDERFFDELSRNNIGLAV